MNRQALPTGFPSSPVVLNLHRSFRPRLSRLCKDLKGGNEWSDSEGLLVCFSLAVRCGGSGTCRHRLTDSTMNLGHYPTEGAPFVISGLALVTSSNCNVCGDPGAALANHDKLSQRRDNQLRVYQ